MKRGLRTRGLRPDIPAEHVEYLLDGNYGSNLEKYLFAGGREAVRSTWEILRDEILADWVRDRPGTRPWAWWEFDGPKAPFPGAPDWVNDRLLEPRRRLDGEQYMHARGTIPIFRFGIPRYWREYAPGTSVSFESQATFLKRRGLLLVGEEKRLKDADFEPEVIGS
jgi:hypothetical protein